MISTFLKKWRLLVETVLIVIGILVIKLIAEYFSLEFFHITPLFTSIIAGGIFIVSFLLSGTVADYKESDKLPSEIAAALESIYEDALYAKELKKDFSLILLRDRLQTIIKGFREDLGKDGSRKAIKAVANLTPSLLEMERLGIPANYIVRFKQDLSTIRKSLLRIYHIQRIRFLPSAYNLAISIVSMIILLLIVTKIEPFADSLILVGFISFIFVYVLKLLHMMDIPFRIDDYTMDDVSLFLLREANERIGKRYKT